MCGRFNVIDDPALQALLEELGVEGPIGRRINVAPTEAVAVVVEEQGQRAMRDMRWWLVPSWAKEVTTQYSMFNARAETLDKSRAFRGPFRHRRGIVPASSFIEWQKVDGRKMPWLIHSHDRALALAALWEIWERDGNYLESCTIITTDAVAGFRHLHHRMPVMLHSDECNTWLNSDTPLEQAQALLQPSLSTTLELEPLDTAINNSRNKGEELLTPVGQGKQVESESD